ncbi:Beta-arrestin arr-1 [Amphibalanus amphitrite]|uniref:Beta-arrestin arr-1 n=1 Tax=Amphibalanus amphitrite TaxID=1232801 RepID=A0A6A4WLG3_AMPAM|nr:Beta-arrestin arr-1 [Amphibalanus amphitrite]
MKEGCPVGPGFTLSKVYTLTPLLAHNKDKYGLALDGQLKCEDTNLASSTIISETVPKESLGIIVKYKVKVRLILGGLAGELSAELPFTLMHPKPEEEEVTKPAASPRAESPSEEPADANLIQLEDTGTAGAGDHDDDLIFEDFARLRLKAGETEA